MCRNIKTLFNFEPPATEDEIHASALQFVRKLSGFNKPSAANAVAFDLAVEGALPPELSGVYMRNGPNPKSGFAAHWFLGDGMLHGVRLEKGQPEMERLRPGMSVTPKVRVR